MLSVCQHLLYVRFKQQRHLGMFSMLLAINRNASEWFVISDSVVYFSELSVALLFLLTAVETDGSAWYRPLATRDHHLFSSKYKRDRADTIPWCGSTGPLHKNGTKQSIKISKEQNIYQTNGSTNLLQWKQINILCLAFSVWMFKILRP